MTTENNDLLDKAITRANEMVLGASLGVMDRSATPQMQEQARFFQRLFSAVRNVLQASKDGRDSSRSDATMELACAVVGAEEGR